MEKIYICPLCGEEAEKYISKGSLIYKCKKPECNYYYEDRRKPKIIKAPLPRPKNDKA